MPYAWKLKVTFPGFIYTESKYEWGEFRIAGQRVVTSNNYELFTLMLNGQRLKRKVDPLV